MSPFEERAPVAPKSGWRRGVLIARNWMTDPDRQERLRALAYHYRTYLLAVVLPTVIAALYFMLIAAPQYLSEAHFVVLGNSSGQKSGAGDSAMSQMLVNTAGDTHTLAVLDFMDSHDAVASLQQQVDLKAIYNKPMLDFVARMSKHASLEDMYRYLFHRGAMIHVNYDFMNFVGVVKVYAFDPEDARRVADGLLTLGDQLVDRLNKRSLDDALRVARAEVQRAEQRVATVGEKITDFRTHQHELDYNKSADTILDVVGKLEGNLAQARADLATASAYMKPDSARYLELENQVKVLEAQINAQKARLTGSDGALAPEIAQYEKLMLERQFANQDYQSASQALEQAYLQAQRQQLFLVRTVDAKAAEESEYPRGAMIVLTLFITLSVAYGIGWLILAGVREHAG